MGKDFKRRETWKFRNLRGRWRKPRGNNNKMRIKKKGTPKVVSIGYRTPKEERNLHPSGYEDILVHNLEELRELDSENQAARIASKVGGRKRAKISEEAEELDIKVLNK